MNIVGIGTDIVSMVRIRSVWERFGAAFSARILNKSELEFLHNSRNFRDPVAFLAKRYAAKEAVAKALGTGFRPQGILFSEISVINDPLGRPYLNFSGNTQAEIIRLAVKTSHLSLSDERDYALAFVILMG
jgi:holo-[acyl-carrier protein] synthase